MSGIKLSSLPLFPKEIVGGSGIDVVKQNGNWFLSIDYSKFPIISPYTPQAWHEVLVFDQDLGEYFLVPATNITATTDPYWSNVVFLTGFEGPNASTVAVDESSHAHGTAAVSGTAQISTAQFKAGSSSALFTPGVGAGNYFNWLHSSGVELGTTHFTIECFFYLNSLPAGNYMFLVDRWDVGIWSWALMVNTTGHLGWVVTQDGNTLLFDLTAVGTVPLTAWHHAAIDYDGVKYRLYMDGITVATSTTARNIYINPTGPLSIGASGAAAWGTDGYIDEVRITAGVARYATDTSFTVPTVPFPRS